MILNVFNKLIPHIYIIKKINYNYNIFYFLKLIINLIIKCKKKFLIF